MFNDNLNNNTNDSTSHNLSAPFILRPVMTTLLMITLFVVGIYAYKQLPVSNLPDVNFPTISVSVPFPGASPEIMANTVATPLEKEFMTIDGLKSVISSNTLGSSNIILQFNLEKDIDVAAVDVEAAIVRAKPKLPPNLPQDPTYKKVNPSSTPIIYIAVTSPTMTNGELYDYANSVIGQKISIIEGVSNVSVYGSPKAVRNKVNAGYVGSLGLTLQDIASSISNQNQYQPLGVLDGNSSALTIYDTGALTNAQQYEPIIVRYANGAPVRIEALGTVVDSLQDEKGSRRFVDANHDQPAVTLAIQKQTNANIVRIVDTINKLLPTLQSQLPGSLELYVVFDRSISVKDSINDVQFTLLIAFVLVVLVIFIYLGNIRDTVIPSIVMPLSIIGTFAFMYALGFTLNNLSILALTLAIGFIIDDAIVVMENIVRWIESGKSPHEAAFIGSKQISFTIVSMTLSLVAVFIPLIFMAGLIGKLFQEFSLTLTIVTVLSGIISLTLTPMLCSLYLPSREANKESKIQSFSHRMNDRMLSHYKRGLNWIFLHKIVALLAGLLSIILSFYLFVLLPKDFIPNEDIGFIIAYTESEQGTSSEAMKEYQNSLVNILKNESYISSILSISATPQYRQGIIFLKLKPKKERDGMNEIIRQLNQKAVVPGVNVFFKVIPLIDLNTGTQVRGSYQYLLQSLNRDELYKSAENLLGKMRNDPLFQSISSDLEIKTPQVTLNFNRDQASALGIDAQNFEKTLSLAYSGNRISRIQTPIDQYDVILELARDEQRNTDSFNYLYLKSNTSNKLVPLRAIASLNESLGPASINHFDQFPSVTLTFNIAQGIPLSEALERLNNLAKESLSPSVKGDIQGAAQTFQESTQSMSFLIFVTLFAIYIVLGILYESFIHPITILSTLPPAISGGLITLYLMGMPLSLYAFLGIILLIGIVKKNGIMMVDFALDNVRTKGASAQESIYNASVVRFRPIMMTTVAAIMGAVPIAVGVGSGTETLRPLGFVIIGGMIISQILTLFLTPVIYLYLEEFRERFAKTQEKKIITG